MRLETPTLAAVLLLGAGGSAQKTAVVPSVAGTREANSAIAMAQQNEQFAWQILFPVAAGLEGQLAGVALRRDYDWSKATAGDVPAFTLDVEILAGHSAYDHYTPHWELQRNQANDVKVVMQRRTVQMPAVRWQTVPPFPFTYAFTFDQPVTLQRGKTALLELRFHGSTLPYSVNPWLDAEGVDYSGPEYRFRSIGTHCGWSSVDNILIMMPLVAGQASQTQKTPHSLYTDRTISYYFGGLSASRWGAIPLPLDLGPLGAPGCSLYISLDWMWAPIETDPTGAIAALDIPNDALLVGQTLFIQGFVFDTPSNALGIGATQGIEAKIGPHVPHEITLIRPPRRPMPQFWPHGIRQAGWGPVLQLRYK